MSLLDDLLAPASEAPVKEAPRVVKTIYYVQWLPWPRIVPTGDAFDNPEDALKDRDLRQSEELPIEQGGTKWIVVGHQLIE